MSKNTIVNHLFVPLRYLQFLKIIRSTAAAENEPCKVCPLSAYRSPQVDIRSADAADTSAAKVIEAVLAFVIANPAKSDGWKQDADAKLAEGDA